ncbi:hypothetical protein [Rhodobacter sp. 24-YEA-8]|uniref:hypothetical protein n=1 Tax=Rhodobacter sp. 24-YEA-8 TaxID=1884310 RepID=UPI00089AC6B9|nr:hypothetical protein [Rhodobacter sp. 24-YEA-8]SEB80029.1 hypothetical protein SAMN05519105_1335 [Rhodobacter sp. 24-YEA-8]
MLGLGLSLWSVALGASWTPAALFGAGQAGHWAEYNPAVGRLFQDAAGTIPATLADQPVGLAKRLAGSVDAAQATALSRPTLARHPKGGRRNLQLRSDGIQGWSMSGASNVGNRKIMVSTANVAHFGFGSPVAFSAGVATQRLKVKKDGIYSYAFVALLQAGDGSSAMAGVSINLDTGELNSPGSLLTNYYASPTPDADGYWSVTISRSVGDTTSAARVIVNNTPGSSFVFTGDGTSGVLVKDVQIEAGAVSTPYQNVITPNDITEAGKPDIWHLWNDGGDSLNAAPLPAGTYGLAYVDVLGGVTITTAASDGTTPINLLRAERQAQVILRQGAFTAAEEAQIRSYWGGLYV